MPLLVQVLERTKRLSAYIRRLRVNSYFCFQDYFMSACSMKKNISLFNTDWPAELGFLVCGRTHQSTSSLRRSQYQGVPQDPSVHEPLERFIKHQKHVFSRQNGFLFSAVRSNIFSLLLEKVKTERLKQLQNVRGHTIQWHKDGLCLFTSFFSMQ